MPNTNEDYNYISAKMNALKDTYHSLREKKDSYVFSALCIKASFYKNPSLILRDHELTDYIVDGAYDGGVDFLLSDPNSDTKDLVIGQAKFCRKISAEKVLDALQKMAQFYLDMINYKTEGIKIPVQQQFSRLLSELGDESKIHFVLYTSAQKNRIRVDRLEEKMRRIFPDSGNIEIDVFFASDIVDEIRQSESRCATVKTGKIDIDASNNILKYQDDAVIVNVSAFSLKQLYINKGADLLSKNLRYYIKAKEIDDAIKKTISDDPEFFWFRNNGITIICDSFEFVEDENKVELKEFSIINGGQTTFMISRSSLITPENNFYLPCKIIKAIGRNENEKSLFSLEIAKAANSQKAINKKDLKANTPEQIRFKHAMDDEGIFFSTKRGEEIPPKNKLSYKHSELAAIGKLCLAAIFQLPCSSRNRPSSIYSEKYYNPIFNVNSSSQRQIAALCRELLYIDFFFSDFIKAFDKEAESMPKELIGDRVAFAHNARTICIAFVAFASRYYQNNINDQMVVQIKRVVDGVEEMDSLYDGFRKLDNLHFFLPPDLFRNKDEYDTVLKKLFNVIINAGVDIYNSAKDSEPELNQTNFLKKDQNYYKIITRKWAYIQSEVKNIFNGLNFRTS